MISTLGECCSLLGEVFYMFGDVFLGLVTGFVCFFGELARDSGV